MTDTATYIPQAGTMPRKALLALHKCEDGRMFSIPLLEAIGQPPDYPSLSTVLAACVDHGLIKRDPANSRLSAWEITPHGRLVADGIVADSQGDGDTKPSRWTRPITQVKPTPATLVHAGPADAGLDAADLGLGDLGHEFALTSTGRLLIQVGEMRMALDKAQAKALASFLTAHRVQEGGAA